VTGATSDMTDTHGPGESSNQDWRDDLGPTSPISFLVMAVNLTRFIRAPIGDVFAFFDDPEKTLPLNDHAVRFDVVDAQPDGRRTFDVTMRAGSREWVQTVEQVVRDVPERLITRGGSWTTDRRHWLLTITTDRRFSAEGEGTRVDVIFDAKLDRPYRRPLQVMRNWLHRRAARADLDNQLAVIAARIEGVAEPARRHHGHSG
jgi:hypothetical protein